MTAKKKKRDADVKAQKMPPTSTDSTSAELEANRHQRKNQVSDELTERADAVDRVLTEKGEPEHDLSSG